MARLGETTREKEERSAVAKPTGSQGLFAPQQKPQVGRADSSLRFSRLSNREPSLLGAHESVLISFKIRRNK